MMNDTSDHQKIHLWIDTDPGIDDAAALAVAISHRDRLQIHGISTVSGNQTLERVTGNALKLVHLLGADDIPVVSGADGPFVRERINAGDIHGKSGLGNSDLPLPSLRAVSTHAVHYLYDTLLHLPEEEKMTIATLGPLTNIALLLRSCPDAAARIERLVMMGGAAVGGNITPNAEFNIWADPESAQVVFQSGVPVVMCGLDVTEQCTLPAEEVNALCASPGAVSSEYGKMIRFYFQTPAYQGADAVCIHDASTICYLLWPEMFSGKKRFVSVDCSEGTSRGMTICDMRGHGTGSYQSQHTNALVLDQADTAMFRKHVLEAIRSFD